FFFNPPSTTHIYTLSLHDALPISGQPFQEEDRRNRQHRDQGRVDDRAPHFERRVENNPRQRFVSTTTLAILPEAPHDVFDVDDRDRKSTRLNSSHVAISYAVFCLK